MGRGTSKASRTSRRNGENTIRLMNLWKNNEISWGVANRIYESDASEKSVVNEYENGNLSWYQANKILGRVK